MGPARGFAVHSVLRDNYFTEPYSRPKHVKLIAMTAKKPLTLKQALPWMLLIGGIIAAIASIALSVEVYQRLKDPSYVPVCNLNPVLSCTSVADSSQSHAFGFPNYYLGIGGYAAIATIGAVLLTGVKLSKKFWQIFIGGLTFATIFLHWLIYETLYDIGSLCIFCMIVWAVTIPMFWYVLVYNVREGNIRIPQKIKRPADFLVRHHSDVAVLWFVIIVGLILKRFWYYFGNL